MPLSSSHRSLGSVASEEDDVKNESSMLKEVYHRGSKGLVAVPVVVLEYLRERYWSFPPVRQEVIVYPLHTSARHALQQQRVRSERSRRELEADTNRPPPQQQQQPQANTNTTNATTRTVRRVSNVSGAAARRASTASGPTSSQRRASSITPAANRAQVRTVNNRTNIPALAQRQASIRKESEPDDTPPPLSALERRRTVNQSLIDDALSKPANKINIATARKPILGRKSLHPDAGLLLEPELSPVPPAPLVATPAKPVAATPVAVKPASVPSAQAHADSGVPRRDSSIHRRDSGRHESVAISELTTPTILGTLRETQHAKERRRCKCCAFQKGGKVTQKCACMVFFMILGFILVIAVLAVGYPLAKAMIVAEQDIKGDTDKKTG